MKKIILAALFLSLTACAATSGGLNRTEMSLSEYEDYALSQSYLEVCLKQGYINGSGYAQGNSVIDRTLEKEASRRIVNYTTINDYFVKTSTSMNQWTQSLNESGRRDLKFQCQKLEGSLTNAYNENQRAKEIIMSRPVYTAPQSNSSTTYCNKFGTQVICNTY